MVLYMAVRYDGTDSHPDLEPNDMVDNGSAPNIGRLSVLLQWNTQDRSFLNACVDKPCTDT
ncbi:MAG TPA: hypothetical protein VGP24_09455 [Glaciihabitans sp.]|jgi:hypothetical protein|nr:hypothetical protein [Glaciihabitans sp.]